MKPKRTQSAIETAYCSECWEIRPCKQTGRHKHDGKIYPIMVCQWCRATKTRRHNKKLNEQHNNLVEADKNEK